MLEFLLVVLGGLIAGLMPGVHINTVAALAPPAGEIAVALALAAGIQATLSWLPSIFLAAPDEETALGVLPGHRLLLVGRGLEALKTAIGGAIGGTVLFLLLAWPVAMALPLVEGFLTRNLGIILVIIVGGLLLSEGGLRQIALSGLVFLLAGLLGLAILPLPLADETKLFGLLTGAFGVSTLLASQGAEIPLQKPARFSILWKGVIVGVAGGLLVGTLPAISVSLAVWLVAAVAGMVAAEEYLAAVGAAGTTSFLFSLLTAVELGKLRNGVVVRIAELTPLDLGTASSLAIVTAAGVLIGAGMAILLAKVVVSSIHRVPYGKLNLAVIGVIGLIAAWQGGLEGIAVLALASLLGVAADRSGVRKTYLMGMLLVPTLLYYWA